MGLQRFLKLVFVLALAGSLKAQKQITIEDIWAKGTFSTKSVPGFNFMNDGQHYTKLEKGTVKKYNLLSGNFIEDLYTKEKVKSGKAPDSFLEYYEFNSDETKLLLMFDSESIYRHSSKGMYFVFDRENGKLSPVFNNSKIINPQFSPDGNKVAFVHENNLYYTDLESGKVVQVTKDGKKNSIINGMSDWVYEEEFAFTRAFYWSANSDKLAFIRFDESKVPEFTMIRYHGDLYPEYETFKYPKVGEKNSEVAVWIYHLKDRKLKKVDIGSLDDMYIPRVEWTPDNDQLIVYKLNRLQNHLQLYLVNTNTNKSKILLEEKNKYYIEIHDNLEFLSDNNRFVWTSEKDGYNRIYLYDMTGRELTTVNEGNYDVTEYYGIDEKRGEIYFKAAMDSPMEHKVYAVKMDDTKKLRVLTPFQGMNNAQFSSTFDYFVNNHSTINTAPTYTVYDNDANEIRVIESNEKQKELQKEYGVSEIEFFSFTTSENVKLNGWILMPHHFRPDRKYPVFMTLYGGPGSQQVTNGWKGANYWFYQLLAQNGYVVACVDNRGTGARGEEFRKMTYLQLGYYETIDQIEAAKYLGRLPYVDATRIGIFGWSYGGFMSTNCLLKGNEVFKAAIAVAPVTNWKWYDSIYTERYMRTLKDNEKGYRDNSPVNYADQLKGHFLIVHGEADDNVHYQHTAEMVNALVKANKTFDMIAYPNRNHSIYGGFTRAHLYNKMVSFIFEKL